MLYHDTIPPGLEVGAETVFHRIVMEGLGKEKYFLEPWMKQVTQKMQGLGGRKSKGRSLLGVEGGVVTLTVLSYLAWLSGLAFKGLQREDCGRAHHACVWDGVGEGGQTNPWVWEVLTVGQ